MSQSAPTLAGYQTFITNVMGVPTAAFGVAGLGAPIIAYTFQNALAWVNTDIAIVCGSQSFGGWSVYAEAVYNLAGDYLVNYAQDPTPPYVYPTGNPDGLGYFAYLRKTLNINNFLTGVVTSSSDEGTSQSLIVQEAMKNITLADLQNLKTPWGRRYLAIAQQAGPTIWGIS